MTDRAGMTHPSQESETGKESAMRTVRDVSERSRQNGYPLFEDATLAALDAYTDAEIADEYARRFPHPFPAIEEQAATEARRELLAKVEGLPRHYLGNDAEPQVVELTAVLRLIEAEEPR